MKSAVTRTKKIETPTKGIPKQPGLYFSEKTDSYMLVSPCSGEIVTWTMDNTNFAGNDNVKIWAKELIWERLPKGSTLTITQDD